MEREVSRLTLKLFGPLEAQIGGQPLPRLRTRRGEWLPVLLALRAGQAVERGWLAGTLWPESSRLFGAAEAQQTAFSTAAGSPAWPSPHGELAAARSMLSREAFAAAWTTGQRLTREENPP